MKMSIGLFTNACCWQGGEDTGVYLAETSLAPEEEGRWVGFFIQVGQPCASCITYHEQLMNALSYLCKMCQYAFWCHTLEPRPAWWDVAAVSGPVGGAYRSAVFLDHRGQRHPTQDISQRIMHHRGRMLRESGVKPGYRQGQDCHIHTNDQ